LKFNIDNIKDLFLGLFFSLKNSIKIFDKSKKHYYNNNRMKCRKKEGNRKCL